MNPVPPRSSPSTARAVVLVAALALLWGSNFLWIKVGLEGLSPVQLTVGRLALGALVLLPLLAVRGERLPRDRAVWGHLVMAALLANAAPYLLFAVGEQSVDSALAGVLNATTPLWTVAVALLARQQRRLSVAQGAGLVLGFVGVVVILGVGTGDRIDVAGALACLAASASYGLSYVYISRYLTGRGLPPLVLSTGQLLGATALLALVVPVAGLQPVSLSWAVVGAMVALGPLGTGLAFVINYQLIDRDGPTAASTVTYLLPVVSVALGAVVLSERLTIGLAVGVPIVLAGVALSRRQPAADRG